MTKQELNELRKEKLPTYFVVNEGDGFYNFFNVDEFDKNGRYINNPEYDIEDFDVVFHVTGVNALAIVDAYVNSMNDE